MSEGPVRLALIGAGSWGKRYIRTIGAMDEVRLACLCTRHPENASLVGYPVETVEDWKQACESSHVDGIVVSSPAETHAEILRFCLDRKKPALVEKPLCLKLGEAIDLKTRAEASGVPVLVDHTQLFQPAIEEIRRRFSNPADVKFILSEDQAYGPFRPGGVSMLWDRSPHGIALCLDLLKAAPRAVSCMGACSRSASPLEAEMISMKLEFNSGADAMIHVGHLATEKCRKFTVFGKKTVLVFDDVGPHRLIEYASRSERGLGEGWPVAVDRELPLTLAVREFAAGVRGKLSPRFGLGLAVDVTRVLDAAERSLGRGGASVEISA